MRNYRIKAFTLVEIMIVVLIIGILIAIAVPNWLSARTQARAKAVMRDLQEIDTAKQQFTFIMSLSPGAPVNNGTDLAPNYMVTWPTGPVPGTYAANPIGTDPTFNGQNLDYYNQHCGSMIDSQCPF